MTTFKPFWSKASGNWYKAINKDFGEMSMNVVYFDIPIHFKI